MHAPPVDEADPRARKGRANSKIRVTGAGIHWFSRTTGLNVLLDDVQPPPESWDRAPRYVSIALTNACELRCSFCYAPKTPARLARADVTRWAEQLDAEGCLGVGFGGGEPTAHPEFVEICGHVARRTKMAVTFTTHGHRLDERMAARLRTSVHFIRVSMDGVGATYEAIRGRSFEAFRARLGIISSVAPFGLNVVVNDRTVGQLDDVSRFARDVGARELLLLPEQPVSGRGGIDPGSVRRFAQWVRTAPRLVPLAVSEAGVPLGVGIARTHRENPLDAHAHVDAFGVLKADAYRQDGVTITSSVIDAMESLRSLERSR